MPDNSASLFTGGISSISAGVSNIFAGVFGAPAQAAAASAQAAAAAAAAQADILQGQGAAIEGQAYGEAASLATLNAQYTAQSTAIQEAQAQRSLYMTLGTSRAAAAGSGSAGGGSAGDILRSSSQQGALNAAVIGQQGLITQACYQEQAASYNLMQQASNVTQQADIASATGEQEAAAEYQQEAQLISESGTGQIITGAIQGLAGMAETFASTPAGAAALTALVA
jgi:hypothetical protein